MGRFSSDQEHGSVLSVGRRRFIYLSTEEWHTGTWGAFG